MKLLVALLLLSMSACVNQQKVTRWLNNHPVESAGYCAEKYPVRESTDTLYLIDSSDYAKAYDELLRYADSVTQAALDRKPDTVIYDNTAYITLPPSRKMIDSIRASVAVQLRKSLRPCIDSIQRVVITQENTARVRELEAVNRAKDQIIIQQSATIEARGKWIWWFWILVAINICYVLLRIRKIIPF